MGWGWVRRQRGRHPPVTPETHTHPPPRHQVPLLSVDDLIEQYGLQYVDVLKIDTEVSPPAALAHLNCWTLPASACLLPSHLSHTHPGPPAHRAMTRSRCWARWGRWPPSGWGWWRSSTTARGCGGSTACGWVAWGGRWHGLGWVGRCASCLALARSLTSPRAPAGRGAPHGRPGIHLLL